MRRVLPLLLTAVVTLAACGDDGSDTIADITLADVGTTEVPVTDKCATGETGSIPPAAPGDTATGETAAADTVTGDTAPGDTATQGSETQGSDTASSAPTSGTAPLSSEATPGDSAAPDASEPASESTEVPGSTEPAPDPSDPYGVAPEISVPDSIPTELVTTVLEEGEEGAPESEAGDLVLVYYSGELSADGSVFDSNYGSGTPFPVEAGPGGQVIAGWQEGLVGVSKGERIQLDIPAELAYGETEREGIPANSALTFVIDVVDVIHVDPPTEAPEELVKTVITAGEGPAARAGDVVRFNYAGVTLDGTPAENSYSSGAPMAGELGPDASVALALEGWSEGLIGAQAGERLQLDLPSSLAYGSQGNGAGILPDTPLSYVIDVIDVIPMDYPTEAPAAEERTTYAEGDPEGPAAQWYDTVTVNYVLGARLLDEETASSTVPDDTAAADDTAAPDDTEATGTEPAGTESAGTESAGTESASTAPLGSEPAGTEPTGTAPQSSEPAGSEPAGSEPAGSDVPVSTDPADGVGTVLATTYVGNPQQGTPAQAATFELARGSLGVPLPGFEDALIGARPGDKFSVVIPEELGLDAETAEQVRQAPGTPIVAYIEVVDVEPLPATVIPSSTPTELNVTTVTEGSGYEAQAGDTVFVNYIGSIADTGTRIQSNWDAAPTPFVLGEGAVIPGFDQALIGAQADDELQIDIPAGEAYGADGVPDQSVPSDAALTYLVKVSAVIPATTAEDAPTDIELPLSSTPAAALVTDDVVEGDGTALASGMTAVVNVLAVCATNGEVLQNTWGDAEREFINTAGTSVVSGLVTGMLDMQVGGTRIITVPAAQAYAGEGNSELGVGADRDLIFVVELYGAIAASS